MYKNIEPKRLVAMLKEWRKTPEKNIKFNKEFKINTEYWEGQLSVIDNLLQVFQIFK